ncbi:MAG: MBL fold metallo-hydrolase [Actinomycetota bacterium]|nr:MBL fold metallo-hydrolase [Actinomycetota bacterium]
MSEPRKAKDLARADRIQPGLWRLRLPLPWPGVPHVNAFAIAAGRGVVLIDTGMHEPGSLGQLERALDQAGLRLEHIRLLVCTHAHSDHYGQAAPIVDAAGCDLWMHPDHAHTTLAAEHPERALERRIEVARQSGVPSAALESYREQRKGQGMGVARVVAPDRDLLPGVEVDTDLGRWQVHETPGHAPSHVVLHQPDRRLLLSGDHLLGRVSLFFDYGQTPDPVGEFLSSLDTVDGLDVELVLAGHGRPVRDARGLTAANRREVAGGLDRVREAIADEALTAFEIVPKLLLLEGAGARSLSPTHVSWGLSMVLSYLLHLHHRGEARTIEGSDPARWEAAG